MIGHHRRAQIIAKHQQSIGTFLIDHQIIKSGQQMIVASDAWQLLNASIGRIKRIFNLGVALGSFDNRKRI